MNKAELVAQIAEETGLNKSQANSAVDALLNTITEALKTGDKVTLVGFGTFSVADRAARKGRNPKTNEEIAIDARKVARFKPGKELSAALL